MATPIKARRLKRVARATWPASSRRSQMTEVTSSAPIIRNAASATRSASAERTAASICELIRYLLLMAAKVALAIRVERTPNIDGLTKYDPRHKRLLTKNPMNASNTRPVLLRWALTAICTREYVWSPAATEPNLVG